MRHVHSYNTTTVAVGEAVTSLRAGCWARWVPAGGKCCVVTGATGFVGLNLVAELLLQGWTVRVCPRSMLLLHAPSLCSMLYAASCQLQLALLEQDRLDLDLGANAAFDPLFDPGRQSLRGACE